MVLPDVELEALSDEECRSMLGRATVGRIAFVVDGVPVILLVNYRLVSDELGLWILLRTRADNAIDRAPERVAFEIDGIDDEHHLGWSVLVAGVLHHLDHNEVELMRKRFDPKPWPRGHATAWLAIKPRSISGRRLRKTQLEWLLPPDAHL
jgi:nitroimidazol reductase NimA-like FMN-containing flavoprotein (pyridoxamine 5'-phosphate oxidase superfamily)